jgi:Ca2+-binding RTX toxin-like protein
MWGSASGVCGCEACRGAEQRFEASSAALSSDLDKPVWTLAQIVAGQLRWDARWAGEPIPYAFYTQAPPHLAGLKDYSGMTPFTSIQQEATRRALDAIADVSPLVFVEAPDNQSKVGPQNPRFTYAASTSTAQFFTAYAVVSISDGEELGDMKRIYGGEMLFNAGRWGGDAALGSRSYYVLIHETLHSLGLPHPGGYNRNPNEEITYAKHAEFRQDSNQYTVMSYFSEQATGAFYDGLFASTPLLHDIAVLHALYGPDRTTRTGDTTYGFNSNAGGPYDLAANPRGAVFSIWDAGGVDTIDLSGFASASLIDLNPGAFSSFRGMIWNMSIAFGAEIERARGGGGDDLIVGNALANMLWGEAGADHLLGAGGADGLFGQEGDDLIGGQDGDDFIDGGGGEDRLYGDAGLDHIIGGSGSDRLYGQDGDDLIGGQDGDDFVDGGAGRDTLFGDAGADHMIGGGDADRLYGQDGNDLIGGQDGNDFVDGGAGGDMLFGDAGDDHLIGGADNDSLFGGDGDDLIGGQEGDDFIQGGAGRDTLYGDAGADHMVGGAGNDVLRGLDGDDLIGGQDGDDLIEGGAGRDVLYGDAGDDVILGGTGLDQLFGQAGADRFVFTALADSLATSGPGVGEGLTADWVRDFSAAEGDRIDVSGIDADAGLAGDQAFVLVSAFSGQRGQAVLRQVTPGETLLQLDVDGDGASDFDLRISGTVGGDGLLL